MALVFVVLWAICGPISPFLAVIDPNSFGLVISNACFFVFFLLVQLPYAVVGLFKFEFYIRIPKRELGKERAQPASVETKVNKYSARARSSQPLSRKSKILTLFCTHNSLRPGHYLMRFEPN